SCDDSRSLFPLSLVAKAPSCFSCSSTHLYPSTNTANFKMDQNGFSNGSPGSSNSPAGQRTTRELPVANASSAFKMNPNAPPFPGANASGSNSEGPDTHQELPAPRASDPSATHESANQHASGSNSAGSAEQAGQAAVPTVPKYEAHSTMLAPYLVFMTRAFPEVDELEFYKGDIMVPVTIKPFKGAPPVSYRNPMTTKDRQTLSNHLNSYNASVFQGKARVCSICQKPTKTFFSHHKELYAFEKHDGAINPATESVFRPMCHVIPVCEGGCFKHLNSKQRRMDLESSFKNAFGQYREYHHANQGANLAIFELVKKDSHNALGWCGVCRDSWYSKRSEQEERYRKHCSKSDQCERLARERAAGRGAVSGTAAQPLSTMTTPAPISHVPNGGQPIILDTAEGSNDPEDRLPGRSNSQIGDSSTSQTTGTGHQQPAVSSAGSRKQENFTQEAPLGGKGMPGVGPDRSNSDKTQVSNSQQAMSIGGTGPHGPVKNSLLPSKDGHMTFSFRRKSSIGDAKEQARGDEHENDDAAKAGCWVRFKLGLRQAGKMYGESFKAVSPHEMKY
ncbi:hypothetical protein N431DRAFT_510736, partial [Stipitochalara longipes BDJ]